MCPCERAGQTPVGPWATPLKKLGFSKGGGEAQKEPESSLGEVPLQGNQQHKAPMQWPGTSPKKKQPGHWCPMLSSPEERFPL